jgi:signal transduction histidine kinase
VTRPGGGAVIVCANAGDMQKTRVEISPGHLLKAFGEIEGLRYVVMQDHTGILASSTSQIGFQLPVEDPALAPLREGAEFVTREFVAESGPVLEVARIVALPAPADASKSALLRVGLDAGLLQEMRTATRHRATLRVLIFAGSLVLITVLLLAWQRQAVLHREVRKITRELRLREEEAQRRGKLVAMGNLAAGVAHEIRNPLNTIHMLAQSLGRSRDLPETVTDKAGHIRDESARIESIVQQFLDFARPRDPVLESLNLGALIRETVAVHQAALHGDRLRIEVDAPDCRTRLDRHFVVEIVENLVRNAREALQDRGTITVSLDCGHRWAELVVEDDGPGIPPDEREKIFDLYFTTKSSGSGLGLSLVSRMVTAMGGQFSLEPEGGRLGGARFLVRFPRQRSET